MKTINKEFFFPQENKFYKIFTILLVLLTIGINSFGLSPDSLKMKLRPQLIFLTDFDNNVYLLNENNPDYKGEGMFHLMPRFGLSSNSESQHFYGIAFDSDFRKGMYTAPFKSNFQTSGAVNLNFNSGLKIEISDYFMNSEFDLALTELPYVSERQMNNLRSQISYDITNSLRVYGNYGNRWNTYLNNISDSRFKRLSNIYGAGFAFHYSPKLMLDFDYKYTDDSYLESQRDGKRFINNVNTKLTFPLSKSLASYIAYNFENQFSDDFNYRDFADNRAVGGIIWNGKAKLKIWVEAGYQTIVFKTETIKDFEGIVGELGFSYKVSEVINLKLSGGIDGFSNIVFDGLASYNYSDKISLNLIATKKSEPLYYSNSPYMYYMAYNYGLNFKSKLAEFIRLTVGGNMQTRDDFSEDFDFPTAGSVSNTAKAFVVVELKPLSKLYINLNGSYLQLKNDARLIGSYDYDTWLAGITANYRLLKWGEIGGRYQFATRIDNGNTYDYNNSRFGFFIKLII
jgi:hypothetical protein